MYTKSGAARSSHAAVVLFAVCVAVTNGGPARSSPPVTIDSATLGTGGGAFCDATRTDLNGAIRAEISKAILNNDTAKIKAYYEGETAQMAKLRASAPASVIDAVVTDLKRHAIVAAAMKKVGYVFTKLDPAAIIMLTNPAPSYLTAHAKVNVYLTSTCHIDVTRAYALGGAFGPVTP